MSRTERSGPASTGDGKEIHLECYDCHRETVHQIVRSVEYTEHYIDGTFTVDSWSEYQIIECRGCQSVGFRETHANELEFDTDPETGHSVPNREETLFPHRLAGRGEVDSMWTLPEDIKSIYRETLSAIRSSLTVLAGIGLRAIIETVCKEREATGANLERRIDALVIQGVLTREGAEVLHGLRILGNQAAHEVRPHSLETLNVAMDVVDHLLMGVYIIPARAQRLPRRAST